MSIKKMTLLAFYTAIALTIFVAESAIPTFIPVPGVKLGLANIITLWLMLYTKSGDALLVLLMRITLSSIFAGQMLSFFYSLCGGLCCFAVMSLLYKLLGKSFLIFISIFGALFHNLGQLLAAILILQSFSILTYLPILTISAILTGSFTGLCTYFTSKKLPRSLVWPL